MRKIFTFILVWISGYAWGQNSATTYIDQHKDLAIKQMLKHRIPASIILGVAMHESGNGTSKVARLLNNHFGMKGINSNKQFRSSYKSYDSVALSYADFSTMLKSRKQFSSLFSTCSPYDYKGWAHGMQRGRYAASKLWASQVIALVRKYRLYEYDNRPADYVEPAANHAPLVKTTRSKKRATLHAVKKGDTLSALAKKHKTSVAKLRKQNHLKTDHLQVGQKLKTNLR